MIGFGNMIINLKLEISQEELEAFHKRIDFSVHNTPNIVNDVDYTNVLQQILDQLEEIKPLREYRLQKKFF